MSTIKTIFLDRDGVINQKLPEGRYVTRPADLKLLSGAGSAIARLNARGCKVILVTNQRAIGLGLLKEDDLNLLHQRLAQDLAAYGAHLDAIYYCPHDHHAQRCSCRKPETGLFEQAMKDFPDITAENSIVIGDSLSDIQAGVRLNMPTVFISGNPQTRKTGAEEAATLATAVANSLEEAVNAILIDSTKSTV